MRHEATATVVDGKWRVTVPGIDRHADTGYLLRIEFEARQMIAEHHGIDPDSFDVGVTFQSPPAKWVDPDGLEYARAGMRNPRTGSMTERWIPLIRDLPK